MSLGQPLTKFDLPPSARAWLMHSANPGRQWFLQGCFYEAHEAWELYWKSLPRFWRSEVQAWILVCGVQIHRANRRTDAAHRLLSLALLRLEESAELRRQNPGTQSLTSQASLEALNRWVRDSNPGARAPSILELVPQFRSIQDFGLCSGLLSSSY